MNKLKHFLLFEGIAVVGGLLFNYSLKYFNTPEPVIVTILWVALFTVVAIAPVVFPNRGQNQKKPESIRRH
jgi:hypothetical protein